jgi:predicted RNA-binding Zn-ribbon protein involved in translation (DUF1610 family)
MDEQIVFYLLAISGDRLHRNPTETYINLLAIIRSQVHGMKCVSCGKKVETEPVWVEFICPGCGKEKIIRCDKCKRMENPYTCKCGFTGP